MQPSVVTVLCQKTSAPCVYRQQITGEKTGGSACFSTVLQERAYRPGNVFYIFRLLFRNFLCPFCPLAARLKGLYMLIIQNTICGAAAAKKTDSQSPAFAAPGRPEMPGYPYCACPRFSSSHIFPCCPFICFVGADDLSCSYRAFPSVKIKF